MCSRGLGKGGSQTVLLPKGKEAGRHSYFSSGVMYVKVSQWKREDMREQIAGGNTHQKERGKKEHGILEA